MRLVEFVKVFVCVTGVLGIIGFAFSAWSAWKLRHEIKLAEVRRAAQIIRAERRYKRVQEKLKEDERDEALVGMGR